MTELKNVLPSASISQIVGVVNDIRHAGPAVSVRPEYYVDLTRFGLTEATRPYFVVRSKASLEQKKLKC